MEETRSKVDEEEYADDLSLCSSCGSILDFASGTCPVCLMSTSPYASLDPLEAARGEGLVISKAVDAKPKPIILIGVWVLFLPAMIAGFGIALQIILEGAGSGIMGFLIFWIGIALGGFSLVVLFRVTRNYLRPPAAEENN